MCGESRLNRDFQDGQNLILCVVSVRMGISLFVFSRRTSAMMRKKWPCEARLFLVAIDGFVRFLSSVVFLLEKPHDKIVKLRASKPFILSVKMGCVRLIDPECGNRFTIWIRMEFSPTVATCVPQIVRTGLVNRVPYLLNEVLVLDIDSD